MKLQFSDLFRQYKSRAKVSIKQLAKVMDVPEITLRGWLDSSFQPRKDRRTNIEKGLHFLQCSREEMNALFDTLDWKRIEGNELAENIFPDFTNQLFEELATQNQRIVILLSQANWNEPPFRETMLIQAKALYDTILNVFLPVSQEISIETYFSMLGEQCGFEGVRNGGDFETYLRQKLVETNKLFLLVSCFEQGNDELRQQFASIIRSLSEQFGNKLNVVLCGGKKLFDMKYSCGNMSLLNIATEKYCWELECNEVRTFWKYRFGEESATDVVSLSDDLTVKKILKISGGHPQLLHDCLKLKRKQSTLPLDKYAETLLASNRFSYLLSVFGPLTNEFEKKRILERLEQKRFKMRSILSVLHDDLIQTLFWKNLLKETQEGLEWRCEIIRQVGLEMLDVF